MKYNLAHCVLKPVLRLDAGIENSSGANISTELRVWLNLVKAQDEIAAPEDTEGVTD